MKDELSALQEMRDKIEKLLSSMQVEEYGTMPKSEVVNQLMSLLQETDRKAREEGYKKGVEILAWRIDCCTLISELSGWRGAVEMAEEEALNQMGIQLRSTSPKETK